MSEKKTKNGKRLPIFGSSVEDILKREDHLSEKVPILVKHCISVFHLNLGCEIMTNKESLVKTKGIFRESAVVKDINYFKQKYNEKQPDYDSLKKELSDKPAIFICGLLRHFFITLPDPLFGFKSYPILLELIKSNVYKKDKKKALWVLYKLITQQSKERRNLLSVFLFLLYSIDLENEFMKAENLATVITPSLSRKETPSLDDVDDAKLLNYVGMYLIIHFKELFKDDHDLINGIFKDHYNQKILKFEGDKEITEYLFNKSLKIEESPKIFIQTNLKRSESLLNNISPRENRSESLSGEKETKGSLKEFLDFLYPKSSKRNIEEKEILFN